ncbi:hypothetical protein D3C79_1119290 [compost metagenome]
MGKIDRNHPIGLVGIVQAVAAFIDHEDLLHPQHACAGGRQQPDRAGAIDCQ